MMRRALLVAIGLFAFAHVASAQEATAIGPLPPCTALGTTSGKCAQGGTIAAGGPTGSATVTPIITYNAAGQLTAVSSATVTPAAASVAIGALTNGMTATTQASGSNDTKLATDAYVDAKTTATLSGNTATFTQVGAATENALTITKVDLTNAVRITGTSQTADIIRFLNAAGSVAGNNTVTGIVSISAVDTGSAGNSYSGNFTVQTNGLGVTNATLTAIGTATTRGTSPVSSVQLAADGGGGAVKITLTTAGATITGADVFVSFTGIQR